LLGTFLVPNVEMLEDAFKEQIHGNLRDNIGSVVLLSNGYSCEQLQVCAQCICTHTHARIHNLAARLTLVHLGRPVS
tara:strand:- start:196 stop:426 length:231 start_codon:yes stop_codon:yes gene_type:complete